MTTITAATIGANKTDLLALLYTFINKRPQLEFGNYGDRAAYRSEIRSITRQRADALKLLRAIELRDSITAADIIAAFNGRLTLGTNKGKLCLDYCTGQYWPTEYRAAVARLASSLLWGYWRDASYYVNDGGLNVAHYIRKTAKGELGRGIASRWFN
tara:strand:+ start:35 stop:505 length:471 start_codon:yes stop_codon:yes gene_type:complete